MKAFYNTVFALVALLILSACGDEPKSDEVQCTGAASFISSAPPQTLSAETYCSTQTSYSPAHTITGTANYEYRSNGNGAVAGPNPIRFAEIMVKDASDNIIQCGETAADGTFSLSVPQTGSDYTIYVNARADNSVARVYVLDNPTNENHYSISVSFTADADKSVGTITASATGTLEGGAFNIFDKIVSASKFLVDETTNCNATYSGCVPFNPQSVPIAQTFWTKGFNPGSYVNSGPVSYYLTGQNQLFILGGDSGDVDNSDTDHFDDSVIIHEYGHYIEDVMSKSSSPGGFHNGDAIIDARLAWSEGFANYFQAAVTGTPQYRDTSGTADGTPGLLFNLNLEDASAGGQTRINSDVPIRASEGIFREFSISRLLWDVTDTNNEAPAEDDITQPFAEFWAVFTGGFNQSSNKFSNMGYLHELQSALGGAGDWSTVRTAEKHIANRAEYATPAAATTNSCQVTVTDDSDNFSDNGPFSLSNQLVSNDFYVYDHPGGAVNIELSYSTSSTNPADLDIYLYRESYRYGTALASSANELSSGATTGSETISLNCLVQGTYIINVMLYTGSSTLKDSFGNRNKVISPATYQLKVNGDNYCSTL